MNIDLTNYEIAGFVKKNKGHHARYEALIANILNAERLLQEGARWDVLYVYCIFTKSFFIH